MFVFDAGDIRKTIRGMKLISCDRCGKETPHDLTEIGFYITALEVPLAPYKKRYIMICRICGSGQELSRKEFDQQIHYFEEEERRSSFVYDYQKTKQQKKKFCRFCGAKIRKDANFCNECGKSLVS